MASRTTALRDSRQVEVPAKRRRKRTPSDERRKARRALKRVAEKVEEIDDNATERQEAWHETGQANLTAAKGEQLDSLYGDLRVARQKVYAAAQVAEGKPYRGRTSKLSTSRGPA